MNKLGIGSSNTRVLQTQPQPRAKPPPQPAGEAHTEPGAALTGRGDPSGTCCAGPGSWASPYPRRSRRGRWFASGAQRKPGPCRSRRGGGRYTRWGHGRRTGAEPCGTSCGCSARWPRSPCCMWRCSPSAGACSCRSGCRLWLRPGSGCFWSWWRGPFLPGEQEGEGVSMVPKDGEMPSTWGDATGHHLWHLWHSPSLPCRQWGGGWIHCCGSPRFTPTPLPNLEVFLQHRKG